MVFIWWNGLNKSLSERGRIDILLFFDYNTFVRVKDMDQEKLKLIIKNLESLVECLKSEVYSSEKVSYDETQYEEITNYLTDYDEVFYEDDDE